MTTRPESDIIVLQPGIPSYRIDFFERLAAHYGARFRVYASPYELGVLTEHADLFVWQRALGPIRPLPGGVADWQSGAMLVPIRRGDVLVLWGAPRSLSSVLKMASARLRGARVVWWGHYASPNTKPWRKALRTVLMRGASALLFYTEREVAAYRDTPGGRSDRRPVLALNNGIDTEPIARLRAPYAAERREHAVLFIGRLSEKSQLSVALDALACEPSGALALHVVGDGRDRAALERQAQRLGIDGRIHWHGATIDEVRIAAIANRCRMFLYPCDVGLSLIHALAYGLPAVLHSDTASHMPEIAAFAPGRNGVTFPRGNPAGLAAALAAVTEDTGRLDAMSAAARATVEAEFNTARMADRFVAGMAEVMGRA